MLTFPSNDHDIEKHDRENYGTPTSRRVSSSLEDKRQRRLLQEEAWNKLTPAQKRDVIESERRIIEEHHFNN